MAIDLDESYIDTKVENINECSEAETREVVKILQNKVDKLQTQLEHKESKKSELGSEIRGLKQELNQAEVNLSSVLSCYSKKIADSNF